MPIDRLRLANVGPFDDIEFEFDPQVNVFTGPNNSGKSSALWALGGVSVYPFGFPDKLLRDGEDARFEIQLCGGALFDATDFALACTTDERVRVLEELGYSKFIPALRWSTEYRSPGPTISHGVANGADRVSYPRGISHHEAQHLDLRMQSGLESNNASLVRDKAAIQEIIDLDYRSYIKREQKFRRILDEIGEVAAQITDGFITKFVGVNADSKGYFPTFHTVDGDLPLNTLSQGTQSIIQWLAHLMIGYAGYYDFPDDLTDKPGVLIIDEIDAHLHPSWQRRIIPTLTERFPKLQIFCSTHSPLMLAGLKAGQVQLLRRDEDGRVTVSRNERDLAGWTADEILRHFLDLPEPSDLGSATRFQRLAELRMKASLSDEESEEMEELRHSVRDDLLKGPAQAQIERFAEMMKRHWAESATRSDKSPTGAGQ